MEIQKYDLRTNGPTDRLTWVGARDACASKNVVFDKEMSAKGMGGGVCVTNLDIQKDCKIRTTVQYKKIFLDRCFDMTQILCSHKSASP